MLPLAHMGITVTAAHAVERALRLSKVDYRVLLASSLLPDLIDKPLAYLLDGFFGQRGFVHSLGFLVLLFLGIVSQPQGKKRLMLLTIFNGVVSHDILDAVWQQPEVLLWPFYGLKLNRPMDEAWTGLINVGAYSFQQVLGFELVGGILLILFFSQIFLSNGMIRFLVWGKATFDKADGK